MRRLMVLTLVAALALVACSSSSKKNAASSGATTSTSLNTRVTDLVGGAARVRLRSASSASLLRVDRGKLGIDLGQYLGDSRFKLRDASGERGKNVVGCEQRWIGAAALPAGQPDQVFRALALVLHLAKGTCRNPLRTGYQGGSG